jgi:hypothetical protein
MPQLTPQQKQLVIKKLRQLRANPALLARYDSDGDGVVTDDEWERARRDVIRQVLREPSSRSFEVAPIMRQQNRQGLARYIIDHRESVATVCLIAGLAIIATDPGFYAERGVPPMEWGAGGVVAHGELIVFWLNWTSHGWAGFVTILFGAVWGKFAHLFVD